MADIDVYGISGIFIPKGALFHKQPAFYPYLIEVTQYDKKNKQDFDLPEFDKFFFVKIQKCDNFEQCLCQTF